MSETAEKTVHILLLDDHALFRESVGRLLAAEPGFDVAAHCGTIKEVLQILKQKSIDVVLLDLGHEINHRVIGFAVLIAVAHLGQLLCAGSLHELFDLLPQPRGGGRVAWTTQHALRPYGRKLASSVQVVPLLGQREPDSARGDRLSLVALRQGVADLLVPLLVAGRAPRPRGSVVGQRRAPRLGALLKPWHGLGAEVEDRVELADRDVARWARDCQARQRRREAGADQRVDLASFISHVFSDRLLPALIITFDLRAQVEFPETRCCSQFSLRAASLLSVSPVRPFCVLRYDRD